jgi:hypothetical protein
VQSSTPYFFVRDRQAALPATFLPGARASTMECL